MSEGRTPNEPADDTEAIPVWANGLLDSSLARQMPDTGGPSLLVSFDSALLIAGALVLIIL